MSKKHPKAPAPIDTKQLAADQGAENRRTLQILLDNSRTTTQNPFGSTSWSNAKTFDQPGFDAAMAQYGSSGGSAPLRSDYEHDNWTNTQTLSPDSQGLYDESTSQLNELMDGGVYNQPLADAIYSRMRRYQDPADERMTDKWQTNLADRGFQVGTQGNSDAMTDLFDSQSRGRADAADTAQIQGSSQAISLGTFLNGLRNSQVAGVSGMPTTTSTPSMSPVDISGMTMDAYKDAMDKYNAEASSKSNLWGSLLGLGGSVLGGPIGGAIGGVISKKFFG